MERYELEKRYEEDDEIDLVELLKSIIREKKISRCYYYTIYYSCWRICFL